MSNDDLTQSPLGADGAFEVHLAQRGEKFRVPADQCSVMRVCTFPLHVSKVCAALVLPRCWPDSPTTGTCF